MTAWVLIGLGGALGSMARHGVNVLARHYSPAMRFPLGTVLVNLAGCCVIGALAGLAASGKLPLRLPAREFIFVGLLGGFTTFSTFGLDTITLLRSGDASLASWNIGLQVIGGLYGVYLALVIFERLGPR
jgi:CrcB protein